MAIGLSRRSKCRVVVVGYAEGFGTSEPLRFSEANNVLSHEKFELCIPCLLFGVGACMSGGSIVTVFYQTFQVLL